MKHLKTYERKSYAPYKKYYPILYKKYDPLNITMFEELGIVTLMVELKFEPEDKQDILDMLAKFEGLHYTLRSKMYVTSGYSSLLFNIQKVPQEFMDELDMELQSDKYNL